MLKDNVFGEFWNNIVIVMLMLESDLDKAGVVFVHGSVQLGEVEGCVRVVNLSFFMFLWHLYWSHALSENSLRVQFSFSFSFFTLFNFIIDLLLIGLNSFVELISVDLLSLHIDSLVELGMVDSLERRFIFNLSFFGLNFLHFLFELVSLFVNLIKDLLMIMLVEIWRVKLNVFGFLNLINIDLLSLFWSSVQAVFIFFMLSLELFLNHLLGVIDETLHEFGMSLILGVKLHEVVIFKTSIKLT